MNYIIRMNVALNPLKYSQIYFITIDYNKRVLLNIIESTKTLTHTKED